MKFDNEVVLPKINDKNFIRERYVYLIKMLTLNYPLEIRQTVKQCQTKSSITTLEVQQK